jgi:hypothetical protein
MMLARSMWTRSPTALGCGSPFARRRNTRHAESPPPCSHAQVPADIVMRVVHPLCCSKPPCPLLKEPAGSKMEKFAVLHVNAAYESRKHTARLPSAPLQTGNTAEVVQDARKHQARARTPTRRRRRRV